MNVIKINPADNVAVAIENIPSGARLDIGGIELTVISDIPAGHKIALTDIPAGSPVIKYGYPIGNATEDIAKGKHVHTHNIKTRLDGILDYTYEPDLTHVAPRAAGTFKGFRRRDCKAGVRNEVWIIPTVGCVNSIAGILEKRSQAFLEGRGNVQGIYSFPHPYGCSQMGDDHINTQKILCGLVNHPNAAGVLVLALGCENNTMESMKAMLGEYDPERVKFLVCQDVSDELGGSLALLEELADYAQGFTREDIPMSELVVGLKCGASDGLSGITANPLVGAFSDRLIAEGGSTILTEVPEMFGAETILMNRCESKEIFDKTVSLINDFKEYFLHHNQAVYENPSPGNKAGGITTLEDKSLGCTQKGGSAVVVDVLKYGEPLIKKGLNLLEAPGNDLVASTAEAVSGAHMVLFTTGRGTPFGSPVPTVKISSNTQIAGRKSEWIDFDAGPLVTGSNMEDVAEAFYEYIRKLASGEVVTMTEKYGIRDMAIFKTGITL